MTTAQLTALVTGAVLVFWMVGAYNRLVALRNTIGAAWAQVEEPLQRRRALLEPLITALRPVLEDDEPTALDALQGALLQLQAAVDAVRLRPVSAPQVQALVTAEQVLAGALARVLALLEHHPAQRDAPAVAQPLQGLQEIEPRLGFARQLFNDAAEAYNAAARQFPTRLLTGLYGFGPAARL